MTEKIQQLIKDQCERNREKVFHLLSATNSHGYFSEKGIKSLRIELKEYLDTQTQQTAEAVLSAVREMVEKKRMKIEDFEDSLYARYPEFCSAMNQNNLLVDDLLTQLTNKDV